MPPNRQADLAADLQSRPWLPIYQAQAWPVVEMLNQWFVRLQETAGMPVAQGMRCELLGPNKDGKTLFLALLIPSLAPAGVFAVLPWVLEQMNRWLAGGDIAIDEIPRQLETLQKFAPPGTNNRLLIGATHSLGVPVLSMPSRSYQYGWGSRSRWMESTFTDATSAISAKLARSKVAANRWLSQAGFPVPEQVTVSSLAAALAQAQRMGFPVVIKPADTDGGVGVSAGLEDEASLRTAFERASQHSKNIVLEKHIPGNDYRLGIVNGKLGWATLREPAGVHGDGQSTIAQLIQQANQDPRRGTHKWSNMRPLVIDAPALELLSAQSVTPDMVVEAGRFIRLRRASNISAGGTPTNMMGRVHADNITLAEQVARLFKLDFAGIDFITPDITRSWKEVGGGICEVNGQPQFSVVGPQAPFLAIQGLVQGDGRIPVVVVLTESPCEPLLTALQQTLHSKDLRLGYSHAGGLWVDGAYLRQRRESAFKDGQALLINPLVDAVVMVTDGKEWLRTGLPWDRFDLLLTTDATDPKVAAACQAVCREHWTRTAAQLNEATLAHALAEAMLSYEQQHRTVELQLP